MEVKESATVRLPDVPEKISSESRSGFEGLFRTAGLKNSISLSPYIFSISSSTIMGSKTGNDGDDGASDGLIASSITISRKIEDVQ